MAEGEKRSISADINLALGRRRLGYTWSLNAAHEKECPCEDLVGFYGEGDTLPIRPHPNCFCEIRPFYKLSEHFINEALGQYTPHTYQPGRHPNQYVQGQGPEQKKQKPGRVLVSPTAKPSARPTFILKPKSRQEQLPPTFIGDLVGSLASIPLKGTPDGDGSLKNPIAVGADLELAARLIGEGKHVRIDTPREVSVLVSQLARNVEVARTKGENLTYDLCRITVKGKSLFCVEAKDIPRVKMPQLAGIPAPGSPGDKLPKNAKGEIDGSIPFVEALQANGIGVKSERLRASELKASQNQLDVQKVNAIARAMEEGKVPDIPIFTTEDGYIIDGHHRWAASVIFEFRKEKPEPVTLNSRTLALDIGAGLSFSQEFANYLGIGGVDVGAKPSSLKKPPSTPKQLSFLQEFIEAYVAKNYQPGHHPNQYVKGRGKPQPKPTQIAATPTKTPRRRKKPLVGSPDRRTVTLKGGFDTGDEVFAVPPSSIEEYLQYNVYPENPRITFKDIEGKSYRKAAIIIPSKDEGFWVRNEDTKDEWFVYKHEMTKEITIDSPKDLTIEKAKPKAKLQPGEDLSVTLRGVKDAKDVGDLLQEHFRSQGHDMIVQTHGMHRENAIELGQALLDFTKEFPEVTPELVFFGTNDTLPDTFSDPILVTQPQARRAVEAVIAPALGAYASQIATENDSYGNVYPRKQAIGFNADYFRDFENLEGMYAQDVVMGYHPPKAGKRAAWLTATHELGHTFHAIVDSSEAYKKWDGRSEGTSIKDEQYIVAKYGFQTGKERFATAFTDYKTSGVPTWPEDVAKNGDSAKMKEVIDEFKRLRTTIKQSFIEAYVARNYTPGKHPNQYIKGKPRAMGTGKGRYFSALDEEPISVPNVPADKKTSRRPSTRSGGGGGRKRGFNVAQRRVGADKPGSFSKEYPTAPFAQMPKYEQDTARMTKELGLTATKPRPEERETTIDPRHTFPGKGKPHAEREDINEFFRIKLDQATTPEEVGATLKEYWGSPLGTDFTGFHTENAKELATAAMTFKESFPEAAANIGYYGSISPSAEVLNGPEIQNQPQVLSGLLDIHGMGLPGLYSHTVWSNIDALGQIHEPRSAIVFNSYYFDEHTRLNANYDTDAAEPYNYHVDRGEFTASFATAIHELGHVLENNIKELDTPLASYEAWLPRSNGAEPEDVVSKMGLENGEERFAEAFADYSLNGLPEDPAEAILGDTIRVAQVVEEYKRKGKAKATVKEWFIYNLLEAYVAKNYIPGHHPNQYVKGNLQPTSPKVRGPKDDLEKVFDYNSSRASQGQTKQHIITKLSDQLKSNEIFAEYTARTDEEPQQTVERLINQWSVSSSGDEVDSISLQEAAKQEFGVGLSSVTFRVEPVKEDIPAMRVFLRTMYENTQEYLAANNITSIVASRGMAFRENLHIPSYLSFPYKPKDNPHTYTISTVQHPLASWTYQSNIAEEYATRSEKMGKLRFVFTAEVPASRIVSTVLTGFGTKDEAEVVVLGGRDKMQVTSWNIESKYKDA